MKLVSEVQLNVMLEKSEHIHKKKIWINFTFLLQVHKIHIIHEVLNIRHRHYFRGDDLIQVSFL